MKDEVIKISELGQDEAKEPLFKTLYNGFMDSFSKKRFVKKWDFVPVDIRLRCTNKCNENCAHCFECSGPNQTLNYISVEDAKYYLNSFSGLKTVYMTGGEWSLIYDVEPHYMLKLFKEFDISKTDVYCLQTNCRWIFGPKREEILSDLLQIQNGLAAKGKQLRLSTSIDRYHSPQIADCVKELISCIASDKRFKATKIVIMSACIDSGMAKEKVLLPDFFKSRGVTLKFEPQNMVFSPYFYVCYANDVRIVVHEEGPTMRIGRAAQNNFGYKIFYPSMQCGGLTKDTLCMELSMQEDGMMKWHSYYDWNIMTPYKDKNGKNKPIAQIKSELLNAAWKKEFKENMKEFMFCMIPVYGLLRRIKINKEIEKSYLENKKKVVIRLQKIDEFSK